MNLSARLRAAFRGAQWLDFGGVTGMRSNGQWAIALVCVVLGFILSMQFKVQQRVNAGKQDVTVAVQRSQDLSAQLQQVEKERDSLAREVQQLRSQVTSVAAQQAGYADLAQQLEKLQIAAGLTEVRGPGVRVILDDSARPWKPGDNPNNFIIHDEDILKVVNELLAGGAEAISVNGQRLTNRSEIRCVGPTVMINGVRTATPVEILAIGESATLESSLKLKGGIVDVLTLYSIQVSVERKPEVRIAAYKGNLTFQYAQPVQPKP